MYSMTIFIPTTIIAENEITVKQNPSDCQKKQKMQLINRETRLWGWWKKVLAQMEIKRVLLIDEKWGCFLQKKKEDVNWLQQCKDGKTKVFLK